MRVLALLVLLTIFSTASAGDGYCYKSSSTGDHIDDDCNCKKTSGESEATACTKILDAGAECKVHDTQIAYCAEITRCGDIDCGAGYVTNSNPETNQCNGGCTLSKCCRETCNHAIYVRSQSVCLGVNGQTTTNTPKEYENDATTIECSTHECNRANCCETISRTCANWPRESIWGCTHTPENAGSWSTLATPSSKAACKTSCESETADGCCWYKDRRGELADYCKFKDGGETAVIDIQGSNSYGLAMVCDQHCDDWKCPAGKKNNNGPCGFGSCNEDSCCQPIDACSEWRCPIGWNAIDIDGRVDFSKTNCCGETCEHAVDDNDLCSDAGQAPLARYRGITCTNYDCEVSDCCTQHRR